MQNGDTETPVYTLLRWLVAAPLALFGSLAYVASMLIGGGVHSGPDPTAGILIAIMALGCAIAGYWAAPRENQARIFARVINIVLIAGTLWLAIGVGQWVIETMNKVPTSEAGHSRPGEIPFRVSYGALSVAGLVVFNKWIRKGGISAQP